MDRILEDVKRHWRILEELKAQTDRGAAIIGAAYLEERLQDAIAKTFAEAVETVKWNNQKISKRIFRGNGPLSTFSAKIDIAFALGFFGTHALHDLHVIRSIRNDFAHTVEPMDFEEENIKRKCNDLWYPSNILPFGETEPAVEPRQRFQNAFIVLWNLLWTEIVKKRLVGDNQATRPQPYCME